MRAGYPALSLHGGMDQYDRDSVLSDFKKGLSSLLIGKRSLLTTLKKSAVIYQRI